VVAYDDDYDDVPAPDQTHPASDILARATQWVGIACAAAMLIMVLARIGI
jgi:hypothetical protein